MFKKLPLSVLMLLSFVQQNTAQTITKYTFSAPILSFNALSGAISPALIGNEDEGYVNGIPIGFDFWYMGILYTTLSASTNGWVTLGSNITNAAPLNNLTSGGSPRPVLAPLWDDLSLQPSTKVSYLTTGTAGSRIFTIQYLNEKWQNSATGNTISFQAKLYEGTGKIDFVYRTEAGSVVTPTASIGISAITAGSGNFLSVNNTGSSVSSTVEASVIAKPVTGRTYSFTPLVPVAPGNLTFSGISSTAMTLNWADLSSNEIGFVIYRSTDGVNYTFNTQTAAGTIASTQSGLTPNTVYYWKVYAVTEGALSTALGANQSTICTGSPTLTGIATETCVGGSTGTITATGAGGSPPYTYSLNAGTYQSSAVFTGLAAATYTLNILGISGCVSSVYVTVNPYANSPDDQNATATDSWVGHVYDGISFNSYIGHYTETENFNELFGGANNCFNVVSNSVTRTILTDAFSVKYRMTSTKRGLYAVDLASDDGNRLTVDGVLAFNSFTYQSFISKPSVLINLTGSSSLLYEYFESNGNNQVMFQNLTQVFSNTLSTNIIQGVCVGNTALPIGGNTFGSLLSGLTLSGTGYQWSYSTTPGGARTSISGATGATFTPSTSVAPFNIAGTYYVYRNAALSSVNNISPFPYVATNESNAATIVINPGGQWTGSVSTDWANGSNWCTGVVPTSSTDVVITSSAVRMPSVISSVSCKNLVIDLGATITTTIAGTLNIAGTFTNNGTVINNGTTNFNGTSGLQTFSGINSFYNLTISNASGLLLPDAISVNNNLTIAAGTLNASNFDISVKGNWTNNVSTVAFTAGSATVTFNGTTAQVINGIFATTFNNLVISSTGSSITLGVNVSIAGDLSVFAGTLDLAGFTANRASAGGVLSVANNAILKIGGTNTYPANYTTSSLIVASTVEYSGTNQTVANQSYGNLVLSSSTGAAVKTLPITALTIVGNLSSIIGTGTAVSFTAGSNIIVNGNVSLGASTTFNGSTFSHSIGGNWANSGVFNGNTSTVIFTGSGTNVGGSGTQNFNHLTVTGSGIIFSSANISLTGNLATTGAGTITQSAGTLVLSGAGTTISGGGISLDNMTVSGSVTTSSSLDLTGNLSVSGSFTASAGSVTMSGTSKTISGAGTKNFSGLFVMGSVTTASDFSMSSSLAVNGSLTASGGTVTFTGTSTLSGTANLFNTTVNGTSLQLSSNSELGIANVLTVTAGVLDIASSTPNTVNFNGAGVQNINGLNYYNLILSNGNSKTAIATLTISNNITIGTNTTFIPGAFTHSIYNDWVNNGTFTAGTSTIQFLGTATTNIIGATTFNILTINNATPVTQILLESDVSVGTLNMVNGMIKTGTHTLTITGTRTGIGRLLGHIQRLHSFTTGVPYAFESPDNSITFSSVAAVTSITVFISEDQVSDFPFGNAINEEYDITIPSGTYNATLSFEYEEDELNGNDESTMAFWHYNGSVWVPIGKTTNSTTSNYVVESGITNLTGRWTLSDNANVVQWNGSVSSDWHTAANWTVTQGSASTPPDASDVADLGTAVFTNQPTVSSAESVKNIHFGSNHAVTLTFASGGSISISGNIDGIWSGNAVHTINVNNQTLTIKGDLILSDGVSGRSIDLNIGAGTVDIVSGSMIQAGDASVNFSGAGTLSVYGDFNYSGGIFNAGTGTVLYNGIENQNIADITYNNLTINKVAGLAPISNSTTILGNLLILSGELDNSSTATILGNVTISSGATLQNTNVLHVGGNWINNGIFIGEGTKVIFDGTGTQTISASTFNNLTINKPVGSSAILTGNVVLNGDLTVTSGTFNIMSYDCNRSVQGGTITLDDSSTFIVSANNSPLNFSNGTLATSSTVIADGTSPQFIFGVDFGNLVFRNAGLKTLVAPITIKGNLIIESGASFDGGSETLTLLGNWINNGTYIPSTGTTIQGGITKTISGNTTFNKVTITGTYTNLANVTYNDLLHITSTGSISSGAGIFTTLNGDLINNGVLYTLGTTTFTGNILQTLSLINAVNTVALIVNFNGSVSPVLNSTSQPQYGYLNINNTGGVNPSVDWTILYSLTVGSGASFNSGATTQNLYGSLTNNGTITSSGVLNFVPASLTTINTGSNFTSTGLVNFGGTGAITIAGTPISFHDVVISNTNVSGITPSSNWNITNDFTVNSGAAFNASTRTYSVGGNILNNGTTNRGTSTFTLNGASVQDIYSLSAFSNLTLNKPSGGATISSDITVNGTLNFISGQVQTGTSTLIVSSSGTVTGASQATGWVNGKLQKNIATGATGKTFETGDAVSYSPVSLAFTNVTTAGNLVASATTGDHPNVSSSGIDPSKSVNRYWTLTNSGVIFTTYDATFNFVASDVDGGANTAVFGVRLYDGFLWIIPVTGSPNPTNIQVTGITATGDFAIGEVCNAGTTISYSSSPYCSNGGTASVTSTGTSGGTYSSSSGLTINGSTGAITLGTSTVGQYTVTYTISASGGCLAQNVTTLVVVTEAPGATVSYAGTPYTISVDTAAATFSGTTGGTYSSSGGLSLNSATGTVTLNTSTAGVYTVIYSVPALGGCAVYATTASITLTNATKTWDGGAATNNWEDVSNWNPDGLPDSLSNVSLVSSSTIIIHGATSVNDLSLNNAGLSLTINSGNSLAVKGDLTLTSGALIQGGVNSLNLTVAGDWINNGGSYIPNTNTLGFVGDSIQNIGGSAVTNFNNITVTNTANPGVRVQSNQNLLGLLILASNVFFDADGSSNTSVFKLISTSDDPTQDAAIGILPAGSQITGNVAVQRFMTKEGANNNRIFRYISSPVQNAPVSDIQNEIPVTGSFTGTSACSGCLTNQTMFSYDETVLTDINGSGIADYNDGYIDFPGTSNTETLVAGKGYTLFVRANILSSTLWDVHGMANTGNVDPVSMPVSYTSSGNVLNDGWNLVGNPFPSTIDWNASSGWTKTNLDASIYITDNGTGAATQYATWNGITGTNNGSRYIASGQGFWTKASGSVPVLQLNENTKTPNIQTTFFREASPVNLLRVTMSKDLTRDEAVIHFREDATSGFDPQADAWKLKNSSFNLSSLSDSSVVLAINSWSELICNTAIKLSITEAVVGSYSLKFSNLDSFEEGVQIVLTDNFLNISTSIINNSAYAFNVTADVKSSGKDRFVLHFDKTAPDIAINEKDQELSISYLGNIQWYLNNRAIEGATFSKIKRESAGTYSVTVNYKGCVLNGTTSLIITGLSEAPTHGLTIFPNPVANEVFIVPGENTIQSIVLMDPLGEKISETHFNGNEGHHKVKFAMAGNTSGVYFLKIFSDGKVYIKKIIKD